MKFISHVTLVSFIILGACRKPVEVQPPQIPASQSALTISYHYPSSGITDIVNYFQQRDSIVAKAKINASGQLIISLDIPYPKGNDYVQFAVDAEDIRPGFTGEYQITRSELSGLRGDLQVNYRHNISQFSWVEFMEGNASGRFQIITYDPVLKLIKGVFLFDINSMHDPKVGMNNWVETKIHVEGNFENLQIK